MQRAGEALPLGRTGQRMVLGLLALNPNTAIPRDALIDSLWGSEPPDSAVAIFQTHVSRLRRLLTDGPAAPRADHGRIFRDGASYGLRVGDSQLDLLTFGRMAQQARDMSAAGRIDAACEAFDEALSLWRGEPLAGVDLLRDHPAVTGLRRQRNALILEYADAAFRAGQQARVLPHLRALAAREPLNELAHARLMMALAGSGQQAEALHTFHDVRHRLDAELGVTPSSALAQTHERVLRQELPPAPAPEPGQAEHGPLPVCQLPLAPGDFVGREDECARLAGIIVPDGGSAGVPLAVLSGPPGVGKTSLALHVAHRLRAHFPDGQLWVQLAGASSRPRDTGEVLGELLRSLGVHGSAIPEQLSERAAVYRSRLADRRVLLVADDAASSAQLEALLPGTAGCAVIVTSRLRLAGLPYADFLPLDVLTGKDAVGMLTRIVGSARVAREPEAARNLVAECGLLPLATRISGARLATRPSWPVSLMAKKLADERHRLDELQAGDLSVRASLAVSYETLGEKAQRAFRRLGLLGALDVADWMLGALLDDPDGSDAVSELVDKSLLTPLGPDQVGEPRYRLHDLLRDYATERLGDEPARDRDAALERALRGWLQLTHLAVSRLPAPPFHPPRVGPAPKQIISGATAELLTADPVVWFNAERLNLNAAVEYACACGQPELAAELATLLGDIHYFQCRYDDGERIWRIIRDAFATAGDRVNVCHAQLHLAETKIEVGYAADTFDMLGECITVFEENGDLDSLAMALYWRSSAAFDLDLGKLARRDAERGILVAQQAGNRHTECVNQRILGSSLHLMGLTSQAVAACERALNIAEELGEESFQSLALSSLIFACNKAGQHQRAVLLSRRRLQQARKYDEVHGEAMCLGMMGDAYQGLGRYHEAIEVLTRALRIFTDYCIRRHQGLCQLKLGFAYRAIGDVQQAVASLQASLAIFNELRLPAKAELAMRELDRCRGVTAGAKPRLGRRLVGGVRGGRRDVWLGWRGGGRPGWWPAGTWLGWRGWWPAGRLFVWRPVGGGRRRRIVCLGAWPSLQLSTGHALGRRLSTGGQSVLALPALAREARGMPTEFPAEFRKLIALQHGVVARHQALASGLEADAVESWVRSGQWRRLQRGVYATFTGEPALEALLWAALLRSGADAVLSHETAADLAGLIDRDDLYGLADRSSAPIHVTVPTGRLPGRGRDVPGVVVHHSVRVRQARHPSAVPPRTRVEETVIDLTQTARTLDEAVAWLDRATRRQLTTPERLGTALDARRKVRWRAQITKALGGLSPGPAASEPARPPPAGHTVPRSRPGHNSRAKRASPGRPSRLAIRRRP